jgi:hypothetical protein
VVETKRWIEAVCEPRRLLLAWQSADLRPESRYRWAVGVVEPQGADLSFRYFDQGDEFSAHNQGKPYGELKQLGYAGYPAFDPCKQHHIAGVKAALMRRLPPRNRSDFGEYTERFLLPRSSQLSDLALLGRTEATLPSDGFSLIDPLDSDVARCDLFLEVAGFRHYSQKVELTEGMGVEIVAAPANPYDSKAIDFRVGGQKFGSVNRLQAEAFGGWLRTATVEAWLQRLNGSAERPRAFVFVRVSPKSSRLAA